jgi:membrane-bound transcription factor site-1 protease
MILWLYAFLPLISCREFIITFFTYQQRWELLDTIVPPGDESCIHNHPDLLLVSDFLVLDCPEEVAAQLKDIQGVKGVHPQRTFTRNIMDFLGGEQDDESKGEGLDTKEMWAKGFKGQGVKVAILDSGIASNSKRVVSVKECINFTTELTCEDESGHGTFVASLFTSSSVSCLGLAPSASLYIYKVFSKTQESNTSWFLEALNAALREHVDIVNLSSGGIDYTDAPFTEKLQELVDAGITVVSAIGNDGPGFGTTNNPGEQQEVLGVGALSSAVDQVAGFSSRGPTLWELSYGIGRVKPDLVSLGTRVVSDI